MKNFLSPVLLVLVAVIGYFYILPAYDHVALLKDKRDKHVELLDSIQSIGTKISNLEAQYNSFAPRERGLLTRLIPREAREAVIVNDLTALAEIHNLSVTAVTFEKAASDEGQQAIGEADDSLFGSRYATWDSVVTVQGTYDGFKGFLTDLGRSIRIADVSHIKIAQSETGGRSLTEYQITITIYSLE
ncbi:MAG: hypothetical protein COV34_00240 [Candidatus Zambryskibacteria bacterium CG10_big_fil_rev_8_21_14_0_10_42_12]|uniref:Pilus assembly protein PilO n=1 Tax=Candidatus Zambryskibacteria bacterium CG10_big_fil_rev_8_21_14_0_10_42_12 TaxID=1975115 RepID=A0A2H0QXY3_9BACT|nr:MAG: hypothetical protein COV34_00240 [Candidatus Zambryskibacteria bacterium CG10_big_fil_rev_8_21_14_0_10_42_12]